VRKIKTTTACANKNYKDRLKMEIKGTIAGHWFGCFFSLTIDSPKQASGSQEMPV
jgi:hypothetical protein